MPATIQQPGSTITAVRTYERPDRRRPYYVQWRTADGTRQAESFTTAGTRDTRASALRRQMSAGEIEAAPSREEIRDFRQFKAAIGDTPWLDVVAGWRNSLRLSGQSASGLLVKDALVTYLAASQRRVDMQQTSAATHRQKKRKLSLFAASYGERRMAELTTQDLTEWIDDLGFESPHTFNDYRKHLQTFFAHFPDDVPRNPAERIETMSGVMDTVHILTVQQTAQLFAYALKHHPESLGRLALEAFAGLRFSSAFRLEHSEIDYVNKGILLPRHKLKTRRRFFIDQLPANLWPWLKATNAACWAMEASEWMHLKSRLFVDAKVPHPRNCLRHSFGTYHVAAYKNPGLTATIMCHTSQEKLWSNYYGIATQPQGLAYFGLLPTNVAAVSGAPAQ